LIARLRKRLRDLRNGKVAVEQLVVRQTLSRTLEEYRVPSPAARAAGQLSSVQKNVRVGQSVRFLFTRGEPKVAAWDLPGRIPEAAIDADRYAELLLRAAAAVLQPFEISELTLRGWLFNNASAIGLPGLGPSGPYLAWPGR
jgi:DNA polymerase-2